MEGGRKISIKFLLSNSITGSLIGSGGKAVKDLIAVTDARVNVSSATDTFPGTADRVILVSGTKESVSLAQTLVWEMLGLMSKCAGTDLRLVEWNPRATSTNLGTNNDVEVTGKFTIPALAGGAILGKGGEAIRKLSADTGSKVSMSSKDEALFTQERVITISGSVAACIACTDMILAKLAEQPESIPFVNRGTTYASPLTSTLGMLGADGRGRRVGRKASSSEDPDDSKDTAIADTTITLSVPDELIGNIFGRQGATMREIISLSGAKIVVSARGEFVEGTSNRLVTITGSPANAQSAHFLITQRLQTPSNPPPRGRSSK